jgi:heme/copper-type cytochrome/quinol oxidase subunit 3
MRIHNIGNCYVLGNSKLPKYITLTTFLTVVFGIFVYVNSPAHIGKNSIIANLPFASIFFLLGIVNFVFYLVLIYNWLVSMSSWEAQKYITTGVQKNLTQGFYLFAISEVMLFFGFFWAYFHFAWAPSIELGGVWPPVFITTVNPFGLPVLNTILLVSSGFLLSISLKSNSIGDLYSAKLYCYMSILLGICFLLIQRVEFLYSGFSPSQSVFGSVFFGLTSLHGFHVILGLIGLSLFLLQLEQSYSIKNMQENKFQYKNNSLLFFKGIFRDQVIGGYLASFYWHLVDAIWIILVLLIYFKISLIVLLTYISIFSILIFFGFKIRNYKVD